MQIPNNSRFKDLTGMLFGKLVVKEFIDKSEKKTGGYSYYWMCECECGNSLRVESSSLKSGNTQSCGCLRKSRAISQRIDLTNNSFGRLHVLEYAGIEKEYKSCNKKLHKWKCKCECGTILEVSGDSLRSGNTKSCGCLHKENTSKANTIDLTGKVFGKLTVVCKSHSNKNGQWYWKCKCECGKEKLIAGNNLSHGKSKSCGCRQGNFTHGMWGKPGYKALYLADPVKKLKHSVGVAVRDSLSRRGNSKNGGRTFDYLPYTPKQLKEHLESQFEPWMNWGNYGGKNNSPEKTWNIDHIKPQASFNFTSMNDASFQECWALSNLRPLEKIENITKGSKAISE